MAAYPIQQIWKESFQDFLNTGIPLSKEQLKASFAILNCKTGALGYSISQCQNCGHQVTYPHSCRNRNCPNCQAVKKELWVDQRGTEVIDAPYFHVVFTLPHELNPLLYENQKLLYNLLHRCTAETLLELSADKKYLGALPGIIQILHTWNQELNYHVHMHCIISGGGITPDRQLRFSKQSFFIPVKVLRNKFRGKFLSQLHTLFTKGILSLPQSLQDPIAWYAFKDALYQKDWCPFIKQTFNGFGNAIDYLGRYTHKIAISNSRILDISDRSVAFSARGLHPDDPKRTITLSHLEFIRRFLLHVLPKGFQKIRYFGFLSNRFKSKNLDLIFKLQGKLRFRGKFQDLSLPQLIHTLWKKDISVCPCCRQPSLRLLTPAELEVLLC